VSLFVFFRRPRFQILPVVTCVITVTPAIMGVMVQAGSRRRSCRRTRSPLFIV
jgi:predicted RND superfamily exporter protein